MLYKYKSSLRRNKTMEDLLNGTPATGVETAPAVGTNNERKEKIQRMKEVLKENIASDPTFMSRMHTLSGAVKVVNSLGFGDSGNIIVDKSKSTKDNRTLAVTSAIVGYRVQNIGSEPIKYLTGVWTPDENGRYVQTKAEKVLEPGAVMDLTRQWMTVFCAQPEVSFKLANGKIIKGSGSKNNKDFNSELESYYFCFDKDENGNRPQINDDEVKLNVGERDEATGKWKVKLEFVETFGYLNNPKETTKSSRKPAGEKLTAQDVAAAYVNKMIQESGL